MHVFVMMVPVTLFVSVNVDVSLMSVSMAETRVVMVVDMVVSRKVVVMMPMLVTGVTPPKHISAEDGDGES